MIAARLKNEKKKRRNPFHLTLFCAVFLISFDISQDAVKELKGKEETSNNTIMLYTVGRNDSNEYIPSSSSSSHYLPFIDDQRQPRHSLFVSFLLVPSGLVALLLCYIQSLDLCTQQSSLTVTY